MSKENKICPIIMAGFCANPSDQARVDFECQKGRCMFWTGAYTTEGIMIYDCAITLIATKNSDGNIPV